MCKRQQNKRTKKAQNTTQGGVKLKHTHTSRALYMRAEGEMRREKPCARPGSVCELISLWGGGEVEGCTSFPQEDSALRKGLLEFRQQIAQQGRFIAFPIDGHRILSLKEKQKISKFNGGGGLAAEHSLAILLWKMFHS